MSESVWFEQVDAALIKLVSDNIKIDGNSVNCLIRKPDEDFKLEQYPLISFYTVYYKHDTFRQCPNKIKIGTDSISNTVTMENPCIPFNLYYQVDFWSTRQVQMNSMIYQWINLTNGSRDFNLDVIDTGGNPRSCFCMATDTFKKSDLLKSESRIFHTYITYRIYVEIDENIRTTESMITKIGVNTKEV